jgi:hypothetical protein
MSGAIKCLDCHAQPDEEGEDSKKTSTQKLDQVPILPNLV